VAYIESFEAQFNFLVEKAKLFFLAVKLTGHGDKYIFVELKSSMTISVGVYKGL